MLIHRSFNCSYGGCSITLEEYEVVENAPNHVRYIVRKVTEEGKEGYHKMIFEEYRYLNEEKSFDKAWQQYRTLLIDYIYDIENIRN